MPRLASWLGSSCTRTAYGCAPNTDTCATPWIIEMRCARQARRDRDRRIIHAGQIAHRQEAIADDSEEENAGHDQRGHDGAADEEFGDAHGEENRRRTSNVQHPTFNIQFPNPAWRPP